MSHRADDDPCRKQRADDLTDTRDETESGIEPYPFLRPRNADGLVHQIGELPQRDEIGRKFLVRLDDFGDQKGRHAMRLMQESSSLSSLQVPEPLRRESDGAA